ncbi:hypothetical protein ABC502_14055 [Alkalimonas sp. NCh-2]|uniref:hypothetical protein n=1 Tax=Alkalimonas sp. NCh-2 TaxID=3144846 RepID=UPI0031F668EE
MSEAIKVSPDTKDNGLFCVIKNGTPFQCGLSHKDALDLAAHLKKIEFDTQQADEPALSPPMKP